MSLLATMDGSGEPGDPDPLNRQSAKLQCVVTQAAPVDLTRPNPSNALDLLALFVGGLVRESMPKTSIEYKTAWAASPIQYVSADDAPFLLIHGDADRTEAYQQSEWLQALKNAGVPTKLIRIEGGDHGGPFQGAKNPPDYWSETTKWFDVCLRRTGPGQ